MSEAETAECAAELVAATARDLPRPRIGVMGYYGFGNAGDEILLRNLRQVFTPHEVLAFQTGFSDSIVDIERLNTYDFLVLGAGGLYNRRPPRPFDTFSEWQHLLRSPIGVLGLGVECLDARFWPSTQAVVQRAEFFIVRDAESKRLIGHPKVEVAPDLAFYRPLPICERRSGSGRLRVGINLRPTTGQTAKWIDAIRALPCDKVAVPFSVVPTFDDREPLRLVDPACPDQFEAEVYRDLDLFIGAAFHSIALAIQSGIPAIAMSYHPKVRRLMEEVGLSEYVLSPENSALLLDVYERLVVDRMRVREQMLAFRQQANEEWERLAGRIRGAVRQTLRGSLVRDATEREQSRVSILVHATAGSADEDLQCTVDSCLTQTYSNIEVLVLDEAPGRALSPVHRAKIRQVVTKAECDDDWLTMGLAYTTGDLVAWLEAGSWYARDAVETLARVLSRSPSLVGVVADHYLTHNGVIERAVRADVGSAAERFSDLMRCFVVRREAAQTFREIQIRPENGMDALHCAALLTYLSHRLLFQPCRQHELDLGRSTIGYGQGRTEEARRLLAAVLASTAVSPYAQDAAARAFLSAAFNPLIAADPVEYLKHVASNLPTKPAGSRSFRRAFVGWALVEAAHMSQARGQGLHAVRLLLRAFANDPKRACHRGTLILLVEAMVGGSVARYVRQTKHWLATLGERVRRGSRPHEGR